MARDKSAKERIMNLFIFEDRGVEWLEPLTLTRPAFDLRCGAATLLERHLRNFGVSEALALVRPAVAALCQLGHARLAVNEAGGRGGATILVNARWLAPATPLGDLTTPRLGLADNLTSSSRRITATSFCRKPSTNRSRFAGRSCRPVPPAAP